MSGICKIDGDDSFLLCPTNTEIVPLHTFAARGLAQQGRCPAVEELRDQIREQPAELASSDVQPATNPLADCRGHRIGASERAPQRLVIIY